MPRAMLVLTLTFTFWGTSAWAQSVSPKVRDLLDKAIQAHGGVAALEKLYTASWKGRGLIYRDGKEDWPYPFYGEWQAALPGRYRYTYSLKGTGGNLPLTTGLMDGKAWRTLITGRGADDLPEKLAQVEVEEAHALYVSRLVPLLQEKYQLTAMPVAQRDGRFILGLKVDKPGYRTLYLFFDRQKGLLTFIDRKVLDTEKNQDVMQETSFQNFKTMGGATQPQSITIKRGKKLYMELEVESIEPKAELASKLFEKPPEPKEDK